MKEMKPQKKRDEVTKILAFIYFEWGKPVTDEMVAYWLMNLKGMSKNFAWKVAHELVRRKTYGEPKFQDFWQLAQELSDKKQIMQPYNPWSLPDDGPPVFELSDMPGRPVLIGEKVLQGELPQVREGRRELTGTEQKWIGFVNSKRLQ